MPGTFQPPPLQGQQFVDSQGQPTDPLRKWLELIPPALASPANSGDVPKTSAGQGIQGQIACDGVYLYVATGNNQWKRVALNAF